jgi:isoamylase
MRLYTGELKWDPAVFGYKMESTDDTTFDERDSAPFNPKCAVVDPKFDWRGQALLSEFRLPFDDTILYELHVKGFTKRYPGLRSSESAGIAASARSRATRRRMSVRS